MSIKVSGATPSGCVLMVLIFNLFAGYWLSDVFFRLGFGKDLPWFLDIIIGLVGSQLLVIADIVLWVIHIGWDIPYPIWYNL